MNGIDEIINTLGIELDANERKAFEQKMQDENYRKSFFENNPGVFSSYDDMDKMYQTQPTVGANTQTTQTQQESQPVQQSISKEVQPVGRPMTKAEQDQMNREAISMTMRKQPDMYQPSGVSMNPVGGHQWGTYEGKTENGWFGLDGLDDSWKVAVNDKTNELIDNDTFKDTGSIYYRKAQQAKQWRLNQGIAADNFGGTDFAISDLRRAVYEVGSGLDNVARTNQASNDELAVRDEALKNLHSIVAAETKQSDAIEMRKQVVDSKLEAIKANPKYEQEKKQPRLTGHMGAFNMTGIVMDRMYNTPLKRAEEILEETKTVLSKERSGKDSHGFWKAVGRTAKDEDTYCMGLLSIGDGLYDRKLVSKIEKGEELTEEESILLDAMIEKARAEIVRANDVSIWESAGSLAAENIPFMIEFMLTGGLAAGATKLASKPFIAGLRNYMMKKAGQKAGQRVLQKGALERMTNIGMKRFSDSALGQIATGVNDMLVGATARMPFMPSTYKSVEEATRNTIGANGEVVQGQGAGEAIFNSWVEVMSEASGALLSEGAGALKQIGKAGLSTKAGQAFTGYINKELPWLSKISQNEIFKYIGEGMVTKNQMFRRLGQEGMIPEIGEEFIGMWTKQVAGTVSEDEIANFYSWENMATMVIGFAPMSVAEFASAAAGSAYRRLDSWRKLKGKYNESKINLSNALQKAGLSEEEIKGAFESLDNMSLEEYQEACMAIINNGQDLRERQYIAEQLNNYLFRAAQQNCIKGMEGMSAEEVNKTSGDIQKTILSNRDRLATIAAYTNNDARLTPAFDQWLSDNGFASVDEFNNYVAETKKKGLATTDKLEDLKQTIAEALVDADVNDAIDNITNQTTGQVETVTLNGEADVYNVISGNINGNGNDQIVVMNAKTGETKQVYVSEIDEGSVNVYDAQKLKDQTAKQKKAEVHVQRMYPAGSYVTMVNDQGDAVDAIYTVYAINNGTVFIQNEEGVLMGSIPAADFERQFKPTLNQGDAVLQDENGTYIVSGIEDDGTVYMEHHGTDGSINKAVMTQKDLVNRRMQLEQEGIEQPKLASQQVRGDIAQQMYDAAQGMQGQQQEAEDTQRMSLPEEGETFQADGNTYKITDVNEDGTYTIENVADARDYIEGVTADHINSIKAASQKQSAKAEAKAEKQADKKQSLKDEIAAFREEQQKKGRHDIVEHIDNTQPNTLTEIAAEIIGNGKTKLNLQSCIDAGISEADLKAAGLLSRTTKDGGITVQELGDQIEETAGEWGVTFDRNTQTGADAVAEVLLSVADRDQAKNYIAQSHYDAARREADAADAEESEMYRQANEIIDSSEPGEATAAYRDVYGTDSTVAQQRLTEAQKKLQAANDMKVESDDPAQFAKQRKAKKQAQETAQAEVDKWTEIAANIDNARSYERQSVRSNAQSMPSANQMLNQDPAQAAAQIVDTMEGDLEAAQDYVTAQQAKSQKAAQAKTKSIADMRAAKSAAADVQRWDAIAQQLPAAAQRYTEGQQQRAANDEAITASNVQEYADQAEAQAGADIVNAYQDEEEAQARDKAEHGAEDEKEQEEIIERAHQSFQAEAEAKKAEAKKQEKEKVAREQNERAKSAYETLKRLNHKEPGQSEATANNALMQLAAQQEAKKEQKMADFMQSMYRIADGLGIRLEFDYGAKGNGFYERAHVDKETGEEVPPRIVINPNATRPFEWVFGHELNHRLQELGGMDNYVNGKKSKRSATYQAYLDAAKALIPNFDAQVQRVKARYAKAGITLSDAEAEEELVADKAGDLLRTGKLYNQVKQTMITDYYDQDLWEEFKRVFRQLIDELKGMVGLRDSDTVKALNKLEDLFEEGNKNGHNAEQKINGDAKLKAGYNEFMKGSEARMSLMTWDNGGKEALAEFLSKQDMPEEDKKHMMKAMEDAAEKARAMAESGEFPVFTEWSTQAVAKTKNGDIIYSVIKPNNEYGMNIDFSLICKKRRTLDAVLNRMIDRNMVNNIPTDDEIIAVINDVIREHGFETACRLCFVDAKRFRQFKVAQDFANLYNGLLNKLIKNTGVKANTFGFASTPSNVEGRTADKVDDSELNIAALQKIINAEDKSKGTEPGRSVTYKIAKHLLEHPEDRKLIERADFVSSRGFDAVNTQNKALISLYNSKKGSGGPKSSESDMQYQNDIIDAKWNVEKAYSVGGVRVQSFSDYVPHMIFDYLQMFSELAASKLPAHSYSKEELYVKTFGKTGIKINMSLVPSVKKGGVAAGLDENGNYIWEENETFPFDIAMEIQDTPGYRENCGTIAVGVSDEHIRKMLADPRIRMVIPYHKSGINKKVAVHNGIASFTDYTSCQNTRYASGKKISGSDKTAEPSFNTLMKELGSPVAAAQAYIDWCNDNGFLPKFDRFLDRKDGKFVMTEGYYKLLEDFTTYIPSLDGKSMEYHPQGPVQLNLPGAEDKFGSFQDLMRRGLQEDQSLEEARAKKVDPVVDKIDTRIKKVVADRKAAEAEAKKKAAAKAAKEAGKRHSVTDDIEISDKKINTKAKTVEAEVENDGKRYSIVFHGSAADFDKFDLNFALSGEGSMVYGHGVYVTDCESTGRMYADVVVKEKRGKNIKTLSSDDLFVKDEYDQPDYTELSEKGLEFVHKNFGIMPYGHFEYVPNDYVSFGSIKNDDAYEVAYEFNQENNFVDETNYDLDEKIGVNQFVNDVEKAMCKKMDNLLSANANNIKHNFYTVNIPDDNGSNYIDWNGKVDGDIIDKVEEKLADAPNYDDWYSERLHNEKGITGEDLYSIVESVCESDKSASKILSKLGIVGIKVPTGNKQGGDGRGMNYVIFNENDAKIVDHQRYSITEDSEGNELSQEQQEYFKDSKVRDEEGKLLVMYHGTKNGDFYTFEHGHGDVTNSLADIGFWFSPIKNFGSNFALNDWRGSEEGKRTMATYLNMTNPKIYETIPDSEIDKEKANISDAAQKAKDIYDKAKKSLETKESLAFQDMLRREYEILTRGYSREQNETFFYDRLSDESKQKIDDIINDFTDAYNNWKQVKENYDENYHYSDAYERFRTDMYKIVGRSADDANSAGVGIYLDNKEEMKQQYVAKLREQGYDGIIIRGTKFDAKSAGGINDQYVIFDSNQAKRTDNKKPTENPDIRYSISGNYDREIDYNKPTDILYVTTQSHKRIADRVEKMKGSKLGARDLDNLFYYMHGQYPYNAQIDELNAAYKYGIDSKLAKQTELIAKTELPMFIKELKAAKKVLELTDAAKSSIDAKIAEAENQLDFAKRAAKLPDESREHFGWGKTIEAREMQDKIAAVKNAKKPIDIAKAQKAVRDAARKIEQDNNCRRFSIIGETGAKNLDLAEETTFRIDNLSVAKNMEAEGKDAKNIYLATGWEKGKDGRWRYEIPEDIVPDDFWIKFKDDNRGKMAKEHPHLKLSTIIGKGLLNAYPELNKVKVKFSDFNLKPTMGQYNHNTKTITLNRIMIDTESRYGNIEGNSTLIHEVQHAIQGIEGFARGGNKESYYWQLAGEVESRNVQSRLNMTEEQRKATPISETEDVAREEQIVRYSINGKDEHALKIPDSANGVDFIEAILSGKKKGETRENKVNYIKPGEWIGLYKGIGRTSGKVYGRVKFGEPYKITKDSPEYKDAMIEGTEYDIKGESKLYYPVLETERFDEPKSVKSASQGGARYSLTEEMKRGISVLDEQNGTDLLGFCNYIESGFDISLRTNPKSWRIGKIKSKGLISDAAAKIGNIPVKGAILVESSIIDPDKHHLHGLTSTDWANIALMLSDSNIKPVAIGSYDNSLDGYRIYLPYLTLDSNMIAAGVLQLGKKSCLIKTAFGQDLSQLGNVTFLYGNAQKIKDVTDYLRTQATPAETSLLSRLYDAKVIETNEETKETENKSLIQNNSNQDKQSQLDIIQNNNPMRDDVHLGIRSVDDIKTFAEAYEEGDRGYNDNKDNVEKAMKTGKVTIYSSRPIGQGSFVSTSKMMAGDYAGGKGSTIYSREVPTSAVAWINLDEGQYADVDNKSYKDKTSVDDGVRYSITDNAIPVGEYMFTGPKPKTEGQKKVFEYVKENIENGETPDDAVSYAINAFSDAPEEVEDWDEDYADSLDEKMFASKDDIAENNFLTSKEFTRFFGDVINDPKHASKVVDGEGKPLVVYHGTRNGRFNTFNNKDGVYFFTDDDNTADDYAYYDNWNGREDEDAQVHAVYLNMRKPFVINTEANSWKELKDTYNGVTISGNKKNYTTNDWARFIKNNYPEYDGVIIEDVSDGYGHDRFINDYIVFKPTQIKSADQNTFDNNGNVIPLSKRFNTGNKDIRYSIDSEGNELSQEQQEYFAESKVRDEEGKLLPVYHGTPVKDITVFGDKLGRIGFFTDSKETADTYATTKGKTVSAYLNITRPIDIKSGDDISVDAWNRIFITREKAASIGIAQNSDTYEGDDTMLDIIADYNERTGKDWIVVTADDIVDAMRKLDEYDGVIIRGIYGDDNYGTLDLDEPITEYIPKHSSQIKETTNKKPTENPDIRYSIREELEDVLSDYVTKQGDHIPEISELANLAFKSADLTTPEAIKARKVISQILLSDKTIDAKDNIETIAAFAEALVNSSKGLDVQSMIIARGIIAKMKNTPTMTKYQVLQNLRQLYDLFAPRQIKAARTTYEKLAGTTGRKVNQNGVVIADKLDEATSAILRHYNEAIELSEKTRMDRIAEIAARMADDEVKLSEDDKKVLQLELQALALIDMYNENVIAAKEALKALEQQFNEVDPVVKGILQDIDNLKVQQQKIVDELGYKKAVKTKEYKELATHIAQLRSTRRKVIESPKPDEKLDKLLNENMDKIKATEAKRDAESSAVAKAAYSTVLETLRKERTNLLQKAKVGREEKLAQYEAIKDMYRKAQSDMANAYDAMSTELAALIKTGHTEYLERQKKIEAQKQELLHKAFSDLKWVDVPDAGTVKEEPKTTGEKISDTVMNPIRTAETELRRVAKNAPNGEGYLWNHFMRGYIQARSEELRGMRKATEAIDAKLKELGIGKKISEATEASMQEVEGAEIVVGRTDMEGNLISGGTKMKLTIGQIMSIYAWNKQKDGKAKLAAMNISEDQVDELVKLIDPKYLEFMDWIQSEFLPKQRRRYNKRYIEMFGVSMDEVENYFPLKIAKEAIDMDIAVGSADSQEFVTATVGAIKKRHYNNKALDIANGNAFGLIANNLRSMEWWNAYAQLARDWNTVLSNAKVRTRLDHSGNRFTSDYWKNELAPIYIGRYNPPTDHSELMTMLIKQSARADVAWRDWTAIKQLLSIPAFLADKDAAMQVIGRVTNPIGWMMMKSDFNWCRDNLELFRHRWESKLIGNEQLEIDERTKFDKALGKFNMLGMYFNAGVDAAACAVGAKAKYDASYKRYKKYGYSDEDADRMAKEDAEMFYNSSQQSAEGPYLSQIQRSRANWAVASSAFMNSQFGYGRKIMEGVREFMRDEKNELAFATTQADRMLPVNAEEPDESRAERVKKLAEANVKAAKRSAVANVLVYAHAVNVAWELGSLGLSGALAWALGGGDDDDDERITQEMIDMYTTSAVTSLASPIQGVTPGGLFYNGVIKKAVEAYVNDEPMRIDAGAFNNNLFYADVAQYGYNGFRELKDGDYYLAIHELSRFLAKARLGVDINTWENKIRAVTDLIASIDRGELTAREVAIDFGRFLNVPNSQLEKVGLQRDRGETDDHYVARYIEWKMKNKYGVTYYMYDDYEKRLDETLNEIQALDRSGNATDKQYQRLYEKADKLLKKRDKLMNDAYDSYHRADVYKAEKEQK